MREGKALPGPEGAPGPATDPVPKATKDDVDPRTDLGQCEVGTCTSEASITYLGHGVCEDHWNELTAEAASPDALRNALGIEVPAVLPMEETMKIPTTGDRKTGKRPVKPKAPPKERAQKEAKPKKKVPAESQVVFAFRLSEPDRDRIHQAAGPGGATRFVRAAAIAAANGDIAAFESLVTQAKTNLHK